MHSDKQLAEMNKAADDVVNTLDGFSKTLAGESLLKFEALRNAMEAYASAHGENETNSPGTGWSDAVEAEKQNVRNEFIDLFKKLNSKQLKAQSQSDFKKKDAELNRIYQTLLKNKGLDSGIAAYMNREGLIETEREWVAYRDAWIEFAKTKFPATSASSLSATLTADRVSVLNRVTQQLNGI